MIFFLYCVGVGINVSVLDFKFLFSVCLRNNIVIIFVMYVRFDIIWYIKGMGVVYVMGLVLFN